MQIRSLGYRTSLMISEFDSEISDRGDHLVVATPAVPGYAWGNYVLFDRPPCGDDLETWPAIFVEAFRGREGIEHTALGWDTPDGDAGELEPFLKSGFTLGRSVVLVGSDVEEPPGFDPRFEVRTVTTDADWAQVIDGHTRGPDMMRRYREMCRTVWSEWFGAYLDGVLVGGLGITVKDGVGRYMDVGTHPNFRRRGVCRTLVYGAARCAFERMGATSLVILATEGSEAERVYRSVGFQQQGVHLGLLRWEVEG